MPKRKPKFREATTTIGVKGYLGKVLDPYESKRKKEKNDIPWYLKKSNDLEDMVRKHLGEQKIVSQFDFLLEAKFPGLTFGSLPPEIQKKILSIAKTPEKVNSGWRRWEALPKELQTQIQSFYDKKKEKKKTAPEKHKSKKIVKSPTKVGAKKIQGPEDATFKKKHFKQGTAPKGELPTSDPTAFLRSAKARLQKAKRGLAQDPTRADLMRKVKSYTRQINTIEKAVESGKDWRTAIGPPGPPTPEPQDRPELRSMSDEELKQKALALLPPKYRTPSGNQTVGKDAVYGYLLTNIPPDRKPRERLSLAHKWASEKGIRASIKKTSNGNFIAQVHDRQDFTPGTLKTQQIAPGVAKISGKLEPTPYDEAFSRIRKLAGIDPVSREEHARLEKWARDILFKKFGGNLKSWVASQPYKKPAAKKLAGVPKQYMKVKTGKRAGSPSPARKATNRDRLMPGAIYSLSQLHKKMEQEPEHERVPFAPPPSKGAKGTPGAVGNILQKIYGKLATEYIYGKGGNFDDLLSAVDERYPDIDLRDVLDRYIQIQSKGGPQLSDMEMQAVKHSFSKQELKALEELATLQDPNTHAAVQMGDMSPFEKALGPVLRKMEMKRKVPGGDIYYGDELRKEISYMLKVKPDDVPATMAELPIRKRRQIEKRAMETLKQLYPDAYKREKEQRGKEQAHQMKGDIEDYLKRVKERGKRQARKEKQQNIHFAKSNKALAQASKRRHEFTGEPRDPEELQHRRNLEPSFRQAGQRAKEIEKREAERQARLHKPKIMRQVPSSPADLMQMAQDPSLDPETQEYALHLAKRGKKKALIDLIKQSKAKQMASNESKQFSIAEIFEAFENSWDLDVPTKEQEWESGKSPTSKDWNKELTLESLFKKIVKKK